MTHPPITGVFTHLKEAYILAEENSGIKEQIFEAALILYANLSENDEESADKLFFNVIK